MGYKFKLYQSEVYELVAIILNIFSDMYSDSQSSLIPAYQPGGGMLHGGSELSQCDEDSILPKNLLSPALPLSLDLSPATKVLLDAGHLIYC